MTDSKFKWMKASWAHHATEARKLAGVLNISINALEVRHASIRCPMSSLFRDYLHMF